MAVIGAWSLAGMLLATQAWFAGAVRGEPIAWGRQLQELWLTTGIYEGVLGLESLPAASPVTPTPELPVDAADAVG